jgi:hypothetical protein
MPLTYNRIILAKAESTYGTSAAPAGTDAVRIMNDLQLSPLQLELADRDLLYPYVGNRPRLVTQKLAAVSFSFELTGSGTAGTAPKTGLFFRAAGYSETIVADTSVTYAPIGASYEGITIDCRHGGKKHLITGVRGDISVELKAGEAPMGKFEGLGFYNAPTDTANPSLTFSGQADPLVVNADNTTPVSVFSYSACMESFSLKGGRSAKLHQRAGCTKQIRIDTERKPEGEILIESPTITAKNFFSEAAGQTLGGISWTHGTTAGNILAFASSSNSLGDPEYDDGDGVELLKLPFMPIPTATNGYDDHSFVFT